MDIIEDTKIVFIDIDGTLMNSQKQISQKTNEIIKKITNNGILVVLCSGRPNTYTINKSKEVNASNIVISNSGNLIYNYNSREIIYINEIHKEDLLEMYNLCEQLNLDCVFNGINTRFKNKYSKREGLFINSINEINEPISQLSIEGNDFEGAISFQKYILSSEKFGTGFVSESVLKKEKNASKYEFDVMNKNGNKGQGIKILLKRLNIPISQTMCFGDYVNDFDMFRECDITIAMGNAIDELKKIADYTTLTNDEDGVATFLENELL